MPESFKVVLIGNYRNDRLRSMEQYASALATWLEAQGITVQCLRPKAFLGALRPSPTGPGKWLGYFDKWILFPWLLRWHCWQNRHQPILYHICDQSNAPYLSVLPRERSLLTVHDLMAIQAARAEVPGIRTSWTGRCLQRYILNGIRRARFVTCVSEATAAVLQRLTAGKAPEIEVIPNALAQESPAILPIAPAPAPWDAQGKRYLLHVGNDLWYKNRSGLFRLYGMLAESTHDQLPWLVVVGPQPRPEDLSEMPRLARDRLVVLSGIPAKDLMELYQGAMALCFPSLMEGFGWPVLEALACGCPVITNRLPPMTEIAGELAFYWEPPDAFADPRAWATAAAHRLEQFLAEPQWQSSTARQQRQQRSLTYSPGAIYPGYLSRYRRILATCENRST
jgi:glycosyltransferase involved in cell wall biosynthesis